MEYYNKLGKSCTASQYITDMVMHHYAKLYKKKPLPSNYYKLEEWSKYYTLTIIRANALLKIYSAESIIRALNDPRGQKIYSLNAKWLDPIIEEKEKQIINESKAQEKEQEIQVQKTEFSGIRPSYKKNNLGKFNGKKQN